MFTLFLKGASQSYIGPKKRATEDLKVPLIREFIHIKRTQREKSELKNKIYIKTLPETCTSVDPETVV